MCCVHCAVGNRNQHMEFPKCQIDGVFGVSFFFFFFFYRRMAANKNDLCKIEGPPRSGTRANTVYGFQIAQSHTRSKWLGINLRSHRISSVCFKNRNKFKYRICGNSHLHVEYYRIPGTVEWTCAYIPRQR